MTNIINDAFRLVADLLSAAGADHVVTMDLHAGQIQVTLVLTLFLPFFIGFFKQHQLNILHRTLNMLKICDNLVNS